MCVFYIAKKQKGNKLADSIYSPNEVLGHVGSCALAFPAKLSITLVFTIKSSNVAAVLLDMRRITQTDGGARLQNGQSRKIEAKQKIHP